MRAAEILKCSPLELDKHPEKAKWMSRAFTYEKGMAEGEKALKLNPQFWKQVQAQSEREEKVRSRANGT